MTSLKSFGLKNICDVDIFDYLNLKKHPMYLKIDKKDKNLFLGISLINLPKKGHVKVTSVQEIEYELRKNPFVYEKNTDKILGYIQAQLIP
jgi:hypothetical protein